MIGKPRKKDETELQWSAIKRAITAEVNFELQVQRERMLNERLDTAWAEFKAKVDENWLPVGARPELEAE